MANQIRYQVGFDVQQNNLNQLKASLQDLQKMKISDIMKINDTDAASATSALNKIKDEAGKVEDALKQAFNTKLNTVNIETFNQSLKQSGTSIEQVYQAFRAAGSTGEAAFRSLSSSVLSTNIQLKETHNILDKMATTLANTVKWNAASSAVNGLTRSVEQAWGYVKSLDTSLNDIRIVTGKSADEMANFAVQANNAAKELGKTTTDYTNAALIYAQQGLNDKEIAERAAITLKAANVTGQSTDAVSEQLTAVWNGYKVNAEEAELYVDRLAAVAATTASDLEELSTGMSKVASAAAAMGVGEDQLAAQLSTIISVTRQAPESVGTALRTVYARISDIKAGIDEDGVTLGNYSGKMAELGINVLDMNGNLRDMGEVMEEIGGKWGDLTREQQVYLAQTMAGQRQYNNLLALFDNFEQYNKALATAQGAAGTLQEQQDIYMESTAAHLEVLRASVEDIYDSLADTDSINGLIDGLSTAATFTANLVDGLGGGGAVLRSLGAIGVTVFSEQIAKGINTTITNLQVASENARQFDQALQATRDWQGIPGLDEVSQSLLKDREQLLELARLMTPEQFTGMQTLLNDITQVGNKLASLNDQQSFLKSATEDVLSAKDSWQDFNDILKDESGQKAVIDRIQEQENAFKSVRDALKQYNTELKALRQQSLKGDSISAELSQSKADLQVYADKLQEMADGGALERHKDQIEKLKQELSTLDDSLPAQEIASKLTLIGGQLHGIASNATNAASEIRTSLENEFAQTAQGVSGQIDIVNQKLQGMKAQFDSEVDKASRAVTIENYAKMAGGIASVGASIQQLQNLGSIWKNEDLTTGQKLLQTITNLAISLPMLVTGFTKATTALGLMKTMTTAEAVTAGISTSAQAAHAVSIGLVEAASGAAAIKVQLLNTTLMINPFVAVAAAVMGLVTALGLLKNKQEQVRRVAIENSQAIIDEQNQKQQQIEKNNQLLDSLEDLNTKYQDGQLTRSELKFEIERLTEQYGLEKDAVDELSKSYNNLNTYIKQHRKDQAEALVQSTKRQYENSEDNVLNTAQKFNDVGNIFSNDYQLLLTENMNSMKESQSVKDILDKYGFENILDTDGVESGFRAIRLEAGYTAEDLFQVYTILKNVKDEMEQLPKKELDDSGYYKSLLEVFKELQPAMQAYAKAQDEFKQAEENLNAIKAADNISFDPSKIKDVNDYIIALQKLKDEIQKTTDEELSQKKLTQQAQNYLYNNAKEIYNQYNQVADYIVKLREKYGESNSIIEQMITNLDAQHFDKLFEIDYRKIGSWQAFKSILEKISEIDFNNVEGLTNNNIDQISQSAAENYNIYQSLEDQVRNGKSISKKQYDSLDPEIQEYFSMMANGSYKMTQDAKKFYETINNLKLDGFFKTAQAINQEFDKLEKTKNFNLTKEEQERLIQPAKTENTKTDYDLVGQQLDFLQQFSEGNAQLQANILKWKQYVFEANDAIIEDFEDIAAAVSEVVDNMKNPEFNQDELKARAQQLYHQIHDVMFPTDKDIDLDALESLSEIFQDIADESEDLADDLEDNAAAAEDLAEAVLRFDDACKDVADNYEDWMNALNSGSIQEQAEAMDGLRDAYADLLDLDGSSLSSDFLTNTENLDLMKAAIDGDIDAYDELMSRAGQDIIAHMTLDYAQFESDLALVQNELDDMNFQELEIGANLDTGNFLQACTDLVNNAGMTAQQATDYLASMGVDAEVVQTKTTATDQHQYTGARANVTTESVQGTDPITGQPMTYTFPTVTYDTVPVTGDDIQDNTAFSLKVISANKSSGGGFKFKNSSNGGGSAGNNRRSSGSGGKGGKGGKGGGSGKTAEPDKSQKDRKKAMEDERDIYHDINIELEQINRRLDRTQKKQDRLYGKQLLDNLNKQSRILDQHKTKLEEKHNLQEQDLAAQQQTLKNLGVTFDRYGNISNYMDILGNKQAQINAKTKEYNSLIDAYNTSTDKDIKKQIAEEAEKLNKQIKQYEDEYKELEDKIKNYDDLREDMEDLVDQIEEETQKQIEINIKKFRMEVEIRLEMGEAERDWNKFRREVLEHTDIIKDTNFQEIFSNTTQGVRDITSYFNVRGSKGSLQTLTEQLMDTRAEIEAINKIGSSAIYGDNKAQAMEDLQNDLKELMGQMEDIQELIDDVDKTYLDTIEDVEEQFDKQIEDYEYVGELIEHDIDLLSLLYGDRNYDAMNKYYETLERNNLKQLDSLKRQRDFWKEQWDAAVARGNTQAAKQFEENYKETIQNLNETVEEAAKNLQNKYINAIDKIFDELDKKISNGKGTDYLNTEWELMNKNADEYLDTINTAFAIQETERKYQKALDETKSIKNQQALKKLMDEQLGILKNKEKVTQYDVDRAEKLLQVEQARIALQDAQSAKTSMRLKRDSQGNYSYEYVADNGVVDDAQTNLAQVQNDLYNFDKERYQSNLDDMLSAWRDFQSDYKDILEDTSLTEQERIERLALLREQYGEYINDKTTENLVVRNNLMESAFADLAALYNTDVENYNQMSIDEQNILMGDLVPAWESGIQQMADKVAGEGGFIPVCEDAFNDITDATKAYKDELDDMAQTAGFDLTDVKNGVDDLGYSFEDLITDNEELTSRMYDELDAIQLLRAEAHALVEEYKAVYDAAKLAISGIHSFVQAQQGQAAGDSSTSGYGSDSGSSSGNTSSSSSNRNRNNSNTSNSNSSSNTRTGNKGIEQPDEDLIEGIAGNIWVYETWGNDPYRHNNILAKFGKERGEKIYRAVQAKFNSGYGYNGGLQHNWEYYKKYSLSSFRSGGYTGSWPGNEGRIGLLHQKEMVLNSQDTSNLLSTVSILRSVMSSLGGTMAARLGDIKNGFSNVINSNDGIEQNVHIDASFPNVDSKREIEEAFNDLVNLAAQRAMRR